MRLEGLWAGGICDLTIYRMVHISHYRHNPPGVNKKIGSGHVVIQTTVKGCYWALIVSLVDKMWG